MEERKQPENGSKKNGDPGRIPTCDLGVRSALLYAAELRGHTGAEGDSGKTNPESSRSGYVKVTLPSRALPED